MRIVTTRQLIFLACMYLVLGFIAPTSNAGSGEVISLPAFNRKKITNGIMAKVDSRWTDGHGYRPVRVTLMVRKTNRDRTIRVVLLPGSQYRNDPLAVSVDVEVPQGDKEVTETVYVPQQRPWNSFRVEFFEGGRMLKDLSMTQPYSWSNQNNTEAPCLLMVDSDAPHIAEDRSAVIRQLRKEDSTRLPDARKFRYLTNNNFLQRNGSIVVEEFDDQERSNDDEALEFATNTSNLEMLPPDDLPTGQVGLAGIDLIVISLSDLTVVSAKYPERFEAIDFFVRAGGNLIVFGESQADDRASAFFSQTHEWEKANKTLFRRNVEKTYGEFLDGNEGNEKRSRAKIPKNVPDFRSTLHGMGKIVAIDSADPYDQPAVYWQWVMREIGAGRLTWTDRHGISLIQNNNSYWDFMIPGFGAAPVEAFLAVISVFILCIGPLNYYLLNKAKRLYLLPITVGIAALLTTFAMMAYAVVSDGVATRIRLHSFTLLDQTNEARIATTHCRQSYLAAFSPSEGLIFPMHTCVYPVLPSFDYRVGNTLERKEAINNRTGQRSLSGDYMRPRSTMQFLITDVQSTERGVEITGAEDGSIGAAANNIGVALSHVWLRDAQGDLFQANDTPPGQAIDLELVDDKQALLLFNKLAAAHRPAPPPGLDKAATNTSYGFGFSRYSSFRSRPIYTETSLLRSQMKNIPSFFQNAVPNSYIVVTEMAPPFLHQGTKAKEEAGFHVIQGRW